MSETIFAQATPPGRSGVAVIRVSGPGAHGAAAALGAGDTPLRMAVLRELRDPRGGGTLDTALVLRFAAPNSYTGEDTVEFHVHGGLAVCRGVQAALLTLPGMRQAEAGEFTRRAMLNGKLDLSQAEGLADVLAAETDAQLRQARALMEGRLSAQAAEWRRSLVEARALMEALIDFSDETEPDEVVAAVGPLLRDVLSSFDFALAGSRAAERLRLGYEVAIVGSPNVGKSTLMNAFARREVAITSEIAGTTRDVIEVQLELDGLPVRLIDLAGIRETADPLEALGVERARDRAAGADMRIFLLAEGEDPEGLGVDLAPGDIRVAAKADLRPDSHGVSGVTGQGMAQLVAGIASELTQRASAASLLGHDRQSCAVRDAREGVASALECLAMPELAAESLRSASRSLDFLIGTTDVDAVLDVVFGRFCIGK